MSTATPNNPANRIKQIQAAHPWMLEREVVGLLTAIYAAACHLHRDSDKIQQEMDFAADKMCHDSRKNLEEMIRNLPPKLFEGD